jgi:hypothetical protein
MQDQSHMPASDNLGLAVQVQALRQLALAVARPGGREVFADLMCVLCDALAVDAAFVAIFKDDARTVLQTLAACVNGRALPNFEFPIEDSPCAPVADSDFHYVARGVTPQFRAGTVFAAKGMDSCAAYPLNDGTGTPLGMLVTMDRQPIASGDADHAETMLRIAAGRLVAEIERTQTDEVLRTAALAV